jgi:16S rRNA (guanine966-N2)-methyltransferase
LSKLPGKLRIIGGRLRGRTLAVESAAGLRPTTDRIRETLFNWLMHDIQGSSCLDLFAGSGALAFEALSRGAEQVLAIEKDTSATKALMQNCRELALEANLDIIKADAITFLANTTKVFDIIFLDPPYQTRLLPECLELIFEHQLLAADGLIYIEDNQDLAINIPKSFTLVKQKKAGAVHYGLVSI